MEKLITTLFLIVFSYTISAQYFRESTFMSRQNTDSSNTANGYWNFVIDTFGKIAIVDSNGVVESYEPYAEIWDTTGAYTPYVSGLPFEYPMTLENYDAVLRLGDKIDVGVSQVQGVGMTLNDGSDDWGFNVVIDGQDIGATGTVIFSGYNNSTSGAKAAFEASSDGSLFGQSSPSLGIGTADGSSYENRMEMNSSIGVGIFHEAGVNKSSIDLQDDEVSILYTNGVNESDIKLSADGINFNGQYTFPQTAGFPDAGKALVLDPTGNLNFEYPEPPTIVVDSITINDILNIDPDNMPSDSTGLIKGTVYLNGNILQIKLQ
jgi:hypothetical protein